MANNIKGITIEIGGNTSPLQEALKDVNKASRDLQSELKEVNKQLKLDPTNTTLLAQKQQLLAEQVNNTKSKLDTLKEAEKQVEQQFKEGKVGEEQYRALQREVIKTEQQLKSFEHQVSSSNLTLSKISATANKVGSAAGNVATKMAPVTLAIGAAGIAAEKAGSDLIESQNKVEVAFGKSSKSIEDFSKITLDKFGIASGSALDMAATFGDMGTSMGLTQNQAAKMSESLVGLSGDLASFKNISIEESQTALNGIFTGESESLKKLGIVMTDTTLKEYAHSKGIKTSYDEMSQSEKVQLRYQYVMEKTKNAQGDFARTSDGAANSARVAKESIKEASETVGVILAPIVAKAAQYVASLAKNFSGLSDTTKKIIIVILALVAAIAPIAGLISGVCTIVGAVTGVISMVSGAIGLLTGTLTVATPAATALAGAITFITGPIGLTILAITALVAGFVILWNKSEGFRNFWIGLWNEIKEVAGTVVNAIVQFFTVIIPNASNSVVSFFTGIPAWFSNLWGEIKDTSERIWNGIASFFSSTLNNIKSFFVNIWNGILTSIKGVITSISNFIDDKFGVAIESASFIMVGLQRIISGVWQAIKTIFLGTILLICDIVTGNFTQLNKDFQNLMNKLKIIFLNIWNGIKDVFVSYINTIKFTFIALFTMVADAGKKIYTFVSNAWNSIKNYIVTKGTEILNENVERWNSIINFFKALPGKLLQHIKDAWTNMKQAIVQKGSEILQENVNRWNSILNFFGSLPGKFLQRVKDIGTSIKNGFTSAVSFIKNLPSEALKWGEDFVNGLINGIKRTVGKVGDAVKGVADKIRNFLHFSVPDEGPLVDYESWMPDFMSEIAAGIENNKHLITNAIKGLATDVNIGMKFNSAAITGNSNVNQNPASSGSTKPAILQLVLPDGKLFAEYLVNDINNLQGAELQILTRNQAIT